MRTGLGREGALFADAIGPGVPGGDFAVRVHSVFRSALNLRLHGDAMLVTLLSGDDRDSPQAIRLSSRQDFRAWNLPPGAEGTLGRFELVLMDEACRTIGVDLSRAHRAQALPLVQVEGLGPAFRACVRELAEQQRLRGCDLRITVLLEGGQAPTEMGARLASAALRLGTATSRVDAESARQAALRLLGLGPGATPTGDDFLCGFLLALHCTTGKQSARLDFLGYLNDFLATQLSATCDLSGTFLRCATRALAPDSLRDAAAALAGERPRESLEALRRTCQLGHGSGADLSTGFLYGLEIWASAAMGRSMSAHFHS